jgi:hypothetical protein
MIPEERRFKRRFEGRGDLIDHPLVSDAVMHHVDGVDTTSDVPAITADPRRARTRPDQITRRSCTPVNQRAGG